MSGSYPVGLKKSKGAVGQNGSGGTSGAYPIGLRKDKGAVGHIDSSTGTEGDINRSSIFLSGIFGQKVLLN